MIASSVLPSLFRTAFCNVPINRFVLFRSTDPSKPEQVVQDLAGYKLQFLCKDRLHMIDLLPSVAIHFHRAGMERVPISKLPLEVLLVL